MDLKKGILLFCIMMGISVTVVAQSPQARFEEANALAEAGDAENAFGIYRELENEGFASGELFYNMGVAAYKLDSLSVSKYYTMRAAHFVQTREMALENISYLNSQFPQRAAELPDLPWERFFDYLKRTFGIGLLFGITILLANMAVVAYMAGWKLGRPRWLRAMYHGLFLLTFSLLVITLYIDYRNARFTEAVMVDTNATVTEAPDSGSAVVAHAYDGFSFRIDLKRSQEAPGWYYVRMSNGLYGWLPENTLRRIP